MKRLGIFLLAVLSGFCAVAATNAGADATFSLSRAVAERYPESRWLGNERIGIVWQETGPVALVRRDGATMACKPWGEGVFFRVNRESSVSSDNLAYDAPEITGGDGTWQLHWRGNDRSPVELTVGIACAPDADQIALSFTIANHGEEPIRSLSLPVGWPEERRSGAEFILPAWVGAAAPLTTLEPIAMVSPGQLHSQWFGLHDPAGESWMLWCDDVDYNLKGLSIAAPGEEPAVFSWNHELWLQPRKSYSSAYRTRLQMLPQGDWNQMAALYRAWAQKQRWFVTAEQKLQARPLVEKLRQGWSWLRGMPPVKEVGGRQCDTTFDQALACMRAYRDGFDTELLFWYTGWYGPFDSNYPDFFPVAPELKGDFESFARQVREESFLVSVHTNSAEWNSGAASFDRDRMATWRGRYYEAGYGDEHTNFVASLPLAQQKWLEEYTRIARAGIPGIYYDVLGHVIAHDDNPRAGYAADEIGRANWTKAKVELWRAYREAMPETFFHTEGNWEGSIPFLDANSGGDTQWMFSGGRRPLPLWQLTYGDTGFFLMLYDGMGQLNAAAGFAVTPLFGAIQQLPQELGTSHDPFWSNMLYRQKVAGSLAAKRMLAYREEKPWRISQWAEGMVLVNDGADDGAGVFPSDWAQIQITGARAKDNGAVTILTDSALAGDGALEIRRDGEVLWSATDNRIAFTLMPKRLTLFNPTSERVTLTVSGQGLEPRTEELAPGEFKKIEW